jgi:hypothetical protein
VTPNSEGSPAPTPFQLAPARSNGLPASIDNKYFGSWSLREHLRPTKNGNVMDIRGLAERTESCIINNYHLLKYLRGDFVHDKIKVPRSVDLYFNKPSVVFR